MFSEILKNLKLIKKININNEIKTISYNSYNICENLWIDKISVTEENYLITGSNHFIDYIHEGQETGIFNNDLRKPHFIYSRIINNYNYIIKNKTKCIDIYDDCVYLHNSFSVGNAGHDLFYILYIISKYKNNTNIKFIIFDEIKNNNYKIIKLLINKDKLIRIKNKNIYKFHSLIIEYEHAIYKINDFINIINELRKNLIYKINIKYDNFFLENNKNKNIILIKNNNNKQITRNMDCFEINKLYNCLSEYNDWYVCNPEKDNFYEFTYKLLNAKRILIGQQGISCCNQFFFGDNSEIIPFIRNINCYKLCDNNCKCENNLFITDKFPKYINLHQTLFNDIMCNGFYFNRIKQIIVSPKNILNKNILIFNNIFNIMPDEILINKLYKNIYCIDNKRFKYNGINVETKLLNYNYGSTINIYDCVDMFSKDNNCEQLIFYKQNNTIYPMKEINMYDEFGEYDKNMFLSLIKNKQIENNFILNKQIENNFLNNKKNSNVEISEISEKVNIYIYNINEIMYNENKLSPESDIYDIFINNIINNYNIVNNIYNADFALIPINFLKLLMYNTKIANNKIINKIQNYSVESIYNHYKFFWDNFIINKLYNCEIKHIIFYPYVLYNNIFSFIPNNILIICYENISDIYYSDIYKNNIKINLSNKFLPVPYPLNNNNLFNQKLINKKYIYSNKLYDIVYCGSFDRTPVLKYYRNFILKFKNIYDNLKIIDINNIFENLQYIKYLFVLRGDTPTRLCFYQCFAFDIVPIIYEDELLIYSKLILNENIDIKDSCLILPNINNINYDKYEYIVKDIIIKELSDINNYNNKIKNHNKLFNNFNWYSNNIPLPISNIINTLSNNVNKLLILVKYHINNDNNLEIIKNIQEKCINLHKNIDIFYLVNDINLDKNFDLRGNILYIKKNENYWEALLEKVIIGIKYFENYNYTDIFITNISTFINTKLLYKECGNNYNIKSTTCWDTVFKEEKYRIITGAGYLISKKFSQILCDELLDKHFNIKDYIWNNYPTTDDICITYICKKLNIKIDEIKSTNIYNNIKNIEYNHLLKNLKEYKDAKCNGILYNNINTINNDSCFYRIKYKYNNENNEFHAHEYLFNYLYNDISYKNNNLLNSDILLDSDILLNNTYNTHNCRNIFLYWVGKEYKLILLLRNIIYLHSKNGIGYNVFLINHDNIHKYIDNIPNIFYKLEYALQADYVRVNVIYKYGGIWLDSDTLVINSLDEMFNIFNYNDGFFIKENNVCLCNGVFGSKKNTNLMKIWKNKIDEYLIQNNEINWAMLGREILDFLYKNNNDLYKNYIIYNGLDNVYPINWTNCTDEYLLKEYNNYKYIEKEFQPFIILVNDVYKEYENIYINNIDFNTKIPLFYFINKSFSNMQLIDYKFIEIGTSNFDTLIENCNDIDMGISVDAVKYYIDKLPNKKNVKKYNIGISSLDTFMDIYYIPEDIIIKNNLPLWFKGCNCINKYHPLHIKHNVTNLCKIEKVNVITTYKLFYTNKVKNVEYLKIDTEGHDCIILNTLFNYIKYLPKNFYPKKILFESNENIDKNDVANTIKLYLSLGYILIYSDYDTLLEFNAY